MVQVEGLRRLWAGAGLPIAQAWAVEALADGIPAAASARPRDQAATRASGQVAALENLDLVAG